MARLSPEAPVPVLKHTVTNQMPGMAGNVVENIKAFTKQVELLTQKSLITKVRYVDSKSNQHIMRFDSESSLNRKHDIFLAKGPIAHAAIDGDYDVIILSDYNKGFLSSSQIESFTSSMNQLAYVDSKKPDISCFKNSIVKLNQKEFNESGHTADVTSTLIKTLGNKGASCNGQIYPSKCVEVFDVSGAGDTFLVSFAVYHTITKDIMQSIKFANKCAGIAVQHRGTYSLTSQDLAQ